MAKVKIDGREVEVPNGTTILQAAEKLGMEVPQMCYHPGLRVVGVCRVCLCQIKGQPKMTPACATEIRDGMEVGLYTPEAEKARRSVIEFWLLNHPLDCPVCDQGGECPLQDIAFDHGPGVSRLDDAKVKKGKRVELGEHVMLDEERCILCWRCTRFTQEVSGSNQMMLSDRGVYTTVGTPPGQIFDDPFSGNVVDLCPVGALTSRDFRFKSRVWEMTSTESVCTACAVGCNTYIWSKKGKVERQTSRPNLQVNDYWLCDRGRYDIDFINDPGSPHSAAPARGRKAHRGGVDRCYVGAHRSGQALGRARPEPGGRALLATPRQRRVLVLHALPAQRARDESPHRRAQRDAHAGACGSRPSRAAPRLHHPDRGASMPS